MRTNQLLVIALSTLVIALSAVASEVISHIAGPAATFNVVIKDLGGAEYTLSNLVGPQATVVAYTSGSCPLSRKLVPELNRIEQEFAPRGVAFVRVATRDEDIDALR
ncbi:MAG: hypothetical protein SGJ09_15590 [Phycisphaerae bacterium]|nr:hypothetical protein [Phycisphaerae bacterium]